MRLICGFRQKGAFSAISLIRGCDLYPSIYGRVRIIHRNINLSCKRGCGLYTGKYGNHYCRANTDKQYLEPVFETYIDLHREYELFFQRKHATKRSTTLILHMKRMILDVLFFSAIFISNFSFDLLASLVNIFSAFL